MDKLRVSFGNDTKMNILADKQEIATLNIRRSDQLSTAVCELTFFPHLYSALQKICASSFYD